MRVKLWRAPMAVTPAPATCPPSPSGDTRWPRRRPTGTGRRPVAQVVVTPLRTNAYLGRKNHRCERRQGGEILVNFHGGVTMSLSLDSPSLLLLFESRVQREEAAKQVRFRWPRLKRERERGGESLSSCRRVASFTFSSVCLRQSRLPAHLQLSPSSSKGQNIHTGARARRRSPATPLCARSKLATLLFRGSIRREKALPPFPLSGARARPLPRPQSAERAGVGGT